MKIRNLSIMAAGLICFSHAALSQITDTEEFYIPGENAPQQKEETKGKQIIPMMKDKIPATALNNIRNAETAFCYTVTAPTGNEDAYTLDGMEITGFCGVLPKVEQDIFINEFLSSDENVSSMVDQCIIQPRLMLRFVRGVDYTDVLYSSPCYSFTVFYGGQVVSFNTSPSAAIMDAVIEAYEKQKTAFASPALINQVLPIGVAQNEEQRALLREKSSPKAVRNWALQSEETAQVSDPQPAEQAPAKKGWNQIKFNRNK